VCERHTNEYQSEEERVLSMSKSDRDNHANQLNPNNDAYHQSRGEAERPSDWEDEDSADANEQKTDT
jgi:hypothetical protein